MSLKNLLSSRDTSQLPPAFNGGNTENSNSADQSSNAVLQKLRSDFGTMLSSSLGALLDANSASNDDKSQRKSSQSGMSQLDDMSGVAGQSTPNNYNIYKRVLDYTAGKIPQLNQGLKILSSGALQPPPGSSSDLTWNSGTLTDTELQIVAVLDRHKDQCPLNWGSLQDKANDSSTPPDLKAAINALQQDPQLFYAIGSQYDGHCGGAIGDDDLSSFSSNHPQVAAFMEKQAKGYENNYIPSDGSGNGKPSVMTENDAMRELYRYSDNLPKHLSLADFQNIVDGDADTGKTPPQVIAAAKYFVDHPDTWKQLNGGADEVDKSDFLQTASSSMSLTATELTTLKAIDKNQSAFFGDGDLTRDKLTSMASDNSLAPDVKQAAAQLLSDPLLFGVLNNSNSGYKTHNGFFDFGGPTVDSGSIGNDDFTQFYDNMSTANRTVQKTETHEPRSSADQDAAADMMMGIDDQPNIKTPKHSGGALMHGLDDVLKVGSTVLDFAATAVGTLGFIPGLGELADLGSEALEAESQAANLLHTALSGGNLKQALEEAGLSLAAQAVGDISGPEVKLAMRDGLAKKILEKAMTAGVNMPLAAAQNYAVSYLNNVQARLEGLPTQGTLGLMQSVEEGGLNSASQMVDGVSEAKVKFKSSSDGLLNRTIAKASTAIANAPLSAAKSYADSYLNNLEVEVATNSTPSTETQIPVNPV